MKFAYTLFFLIISLNLFSQTEKVLELENASSYNYSIIDYEFNNDKLFIVEYKSGKYYYRVIDLILKEELLKEEFSFDSEFVLNDNGLFFINLTNNYRQYQYVDFNGDITLSTHTIHYPSNNEALILKPLLGVQDEYFYFTLEGNKYCVYETLGNTTNGTKVFESTDELVFFEKHDNNIVLITFTGNDYEFYKYNVVTTDLTLFYAYSESIDYAVYLSGKRQNELYINFVSDQSKFIYKTDLTTANTTLFLNDKIGKLNFTSNERYVLYEDSISNGNPYFIGSLNSNNIKNLAISNSDTIESVLLSQRLGHEHFILAKLENGFETAYINDQDSIDFISDLVTGFGSSYCVRNFSQSYIYYWLDTPFLSLNDSTVLTIQTNGNDNYYYVYKTVSNVQTSLFKIDNPLSITKFIYNESNNDLYWLEAQDYHKSILYKRSLDTEIETQPLIKPINKEIWFKQIATSKWNRFFDVGDNLRVRPKDVKIDSEGNVYTYFTFLYSYQSVDDASAFLQEPGSEMDLKARHVFTKFDKYGNLNWMTSVGEPNNTSWDGHDYEFEIDSENNPIIFGYYFETGYFDEDSLTSERAGYFLNKLDGETGSVLWKNKLAETYYLDDIRIDGLTLDEDNNIYLALMYDDFSLKISGLAVEADVSLANAVAKFSPDGNAIWLKNITTPWTDYYGRSYIFNNNDNHTLTVCQTKGTAREQFIQTLDLDGNIIDTNSISTTGFTRLQVGMNNLNNQLFGLGYFNGDFNFEKYKLNTASSKNFSFMYDHGISEPISLKQGISTLFYPVDISYCNNEFYVYGGLKVNSFSSELAIIKFDSAGKFLAYKSTNQIVDNDELDLNHFELDEDFIVLIGDDFSLDSENGVVPLITANRSLSVLKIRNENWIEDADWFESINTNLKPEDNDVLIYPNPFLNEFEVIFSSYAVDYESYRIYRSNGELLLEGLLSGIQFQKITFSKYAAGTYVIQFIGEDKIVNKRIVKVSE
jgi:hypothetical protein